jgi:hypothetical protein
MGTDDGSGGMYIEWIRTRVELVALHGWEETEADGGGKNQL